MGYEIDNDCVGCPQGCVHCGRDVDRKIYFCDKCGTTIDYGENLYIYDGEELCWECYKAKFNEKLCDDCDDSTCSECNRESDYLYEVEHNFWVCEDCLKEMAERVFSE